MIGIDNLTITYYSPRKFFANKLEIKEGEITTIIGKNGSGKSTLLRAMAGIIPYEGSILIDGRECRSYSPRNRAKKIAYLPQVLKSVNMDVRTLIEHGRYPYMGNYRRLSDKDNEAVENAIRITNMTDYADASLTEISGGERQRAYLAMIVAQDTDIILLDEPTTYLDLQYQHEMYEILRKLSDSNKGIVTVCHDLQQSFSFSDKICIMNEGSLSEAKTPDELVKCESLIRDVFNVALRREDNVDSLYPYSIIR